MIVIYTQEKTYIKEDINQAQSILIDVYGKKLGEEAYITLANAPIGASYRKHGGPLIKVVDAQEASFIRKKETEAGMM